MWLKGCDPKAVESRNQPVLFGGPIDSNNANLGVPVVPGHTSNGGRQVSPEAATATNGSNALFRESSSTSTSSRYTISNRNLNNSSGNGHSNVNSGTDTKIPVERVNTRSHSINNDNWRLDRNDRPSDRSDFRSNVNSKYDYDSGRGRGNSTSNHSSSTGSRSNHSHHDRHHDHSARHGDRHDRHDRHSHHNNGHSNYYYEEPTPEWMDEPTERYSMMDLGGFADDHRGSSPQPSTSQSDSPSNSTNSNRTDDSVEGKLSEGSYNSTRTGKGQKTCVPTSNSDESAVYLESLLEDMLKFTEEPSEIPIQQATSVHGSPVANFGSKSSKWFSPSDEATIGGMQYQQMLQQQLHNQQQNSHLQQLQSQQHPRAARIITGSFPTSSMVPHQVLLQARQQGTSLAPLPGQSLKHNRSNEIPVMLSVNQQQQAQQMNLPQVHQLPIHHQQSQLSHGKVMNQAIDKTPADLLKLLQSGIAQQQQSQHPLYGQAPQPLPPPMLNSDQAMMQHQLLMQRQAFQQQIQAQQQQQQQQQHHHPHHHPSQSLQSQAQPRAIHSGQGSSSDNSNMLLRLLQQNRNSGQAGHIQLATQQSARVPFANLPRPTQAKSLDEIERSLRSTGTAASTQSVSAFNKASVPQASVPVTLTGNSNESNLEDRQAFDRLIFKLQQASNMRGSK